MSTMLSRTRPERIQSSSPEQKETRSFDAPEAHITENRQEGAGSSQIEDMTRHWADKYSGPHTRDTRSHGLGMEHDAELSKRLARAIIKDVPKEEQTLAKTYNRLSLLEVRLTNDQRNLKREHNQFMSHPGQGADQIREKLQELEKREQGLKDRRKSLDAEWASYNQRKNEFERIHRPSLQNAVGILRRAAPDVDFQRPAPEE